MRPASVIAAAVAAWSAPALAPVVPAVAATLGVPRRLPRGHVTLTFDDGPHPEGTPAVLRRLEAAGLTAIFFLVGEQVRRDEGLAREIADQGHRVALHGFRHRNLLRIAPHTLRADYDRGLETVERATGVLCDTYRPPYGIFSLGSLLEVRRRNWRPLLWSRWGRDWARRATPKTVADLAMREIAAGDVVLLHDADHYSVVDSWKATVGALDLMLPTLAQRGLV